MSKMDAVRAMREARYAEAQARAGGAAPRPRAAQPAKPAKPAPVPSADPAQDEGDADLCGHRNMSGRTCTRERGHAAKSHRYS